MDVGRLHELMEQFAEIISKEFPEYTDASFSVHSDGFMTISITQWDTDEKVQIKKRLRKELFNQNKFQGKWRKERTSSLNETYANIGVLLGGQDECMAG